MVQTDGEQHAVEEAIDCRAGRADAGEESGEGVKHLLDERPDKAEADTGKQRVKAGHDGNEAAAAEEGEPVGQLGALILVVGDARYDARDDTAEVRHVDRSDAGVEALSPGEAADRTEQAGCALRDGSDQPAEQRARGARS